MTENPTKNTPNHDVGAVFAVSVCISNKSRIYATNTNLKLYVTFSFVFNSARNANVQLHTTPTSRAAARNAGQEIFTIENFMQTSWFVQFCVRTLKTKQKHLN